MGSSAGGHLDLAVVGAHLTGMPLNGQLTACGATLVHRTATAPDYRLFSLPGEGARRPGLVRVPVGGVPIEVEVFALPLTEVGAFLQLVPAPLAIGTVRLADGSSVHGFLCEEIATADALDISDFGGWRAFVAAQ